MSEQNSRPIMSRDVVNSGSKTSLKGFLNEQEFIDTVPNNYRKWAGLGFGLAVILAVGESFTNTYSGPFAPLVAALFGVVVAYVRTMNTAKKLIDEGEELP